MPLPINTASLVSEMRQSLAEINAQIQAIKDDIHDQMERGRIMVESTYDAKWADGRPVLMDLLVAKANVQAAIANLQASNQKGKW